MVAAKLWLVMGGGGKIMTGHGWSHNLVMPIYLVFHWDHIVEKGVVKSGGLEKR